MSGVCCHITVIRRLMSTIRRLITVIWCQLHDSRHLLPCLLSHVWCLILSVMIYVMFDVRHLLSYDCYQTSDVMLCYITVIRRLIAVIWCQTSDNGYMTADVRCLPSYNCYQTSDVIWLLSDVWYDIRRLITVICWQTSDVRCLLSYNCYQMSDVICYVI